MTSKLLANFQVPLKIFHRHGSHVKKNLYKWYDEGIQYPGFKYYPRDPANFEDPPCEPCKLFRVQRIKPVKGCTYYEKDLLHRFGLDVKASDVSIVKNIPEINSQLCRIKHLIRITPITFPNGVPKDPNGTLLKENGELVVSDVIRPLEIRNAVSEQFENNPKKLNSDVISKQLRMKWLRGQ